jgi:hypothetical protein
MKKCIHILTVGCLILTSLAHGAPLVASEVLTSDIECTNVDVKKPVSVVFSQSRNQYLVMETVGGEMDFQVVGSYDAASRYATGIRLSEKYCLSIVRKDGKEIERLPIIQ